MTHKPWCMIRAGQNCDCMTDNTESEKPDLEQRFMDLLHEFNREMNHENGPALEPLQRRAIKRTYALEIIGYIEEARKQGRGEIVEMFEQAAKDFENAMTTIPAESDWNSAMRQSAAKIRAIIQNLTNKE